MRSRTPGSPRWWSPEVHAATGTPANDLTIYDDQNQVLAIFHAYDDDGDQKAEKIAMTFPEVGLPYVITSCPNCGTGRDGYYLNQGASQDLGFRFKINTTSKFSGDVWLFSPGNVHASQHFTITNGNHAQLTTFSWSFNATAVNAGNPADTRPVSGTIVDTTGDVIGDVANVSFDGAPSVAASRTELSDFARYKCWDGAGQCAPALGTPSACSFALGSAGGSAVTYDVSMTIPYVDPDGNLTPGELTFGEADASGVLSSESSALPGASAHLDASATGSTSGDVTVNVNDWNGAIDAYWAFASVRDATGKASAQSRCQPPWGVTVESQRLLLAPIDPNSNTQLLGWALAVDGTTMVASDLGSGLDSGAVYFWEESSGVWSQTQFITAPDPGAANNQASFGRALDIEGDTLLVGAPGIDDLGTDTGAAYVFTRSSGVWTQTQKILPPAGIQFFGSAAALNGDLLAVGAGSDGAGPSTSGVAVVYHRSGTIWTLHSVVYPVDGMSTDGYGSALTFANDTLLVGGHGQSGSNTAVYIYDDLGSGYVQTQKIPSPVAGDGFGWSLSGDGDRVAIGATRLTISGQHVGAVHIYERSGGSWTPVATLGPADPGPKTYFGQDVDLEGSRLIVGANPRFTGDALQVDTSAGYLFELSAGSWLQVAKLKHGDTTRVLPCAATVALTSSGAALNGYGAENGRGAIYVFD